MAKDSVGETSSPQRTETEIVIASSAAGVVEQIRCAPGKLVHAGQTLVVLRTE